MVCLSSPAVAQMAWPMCKLFISRGPTAGAMRHQFESGIWKRNPSPDFQWFFSEKKVPKIYPMRTYFLSQLMFWFLPGGSLGRIHQGCRERIWVLSGTICFLELKVLKETPNSKTLHLTRIAASTLTWRTGRTTALTLLQEACEILALPHACSQNWSNLS